MAKSPYLGNRCHYCGHLFPRDEITRDHIIPKSKGGRTNWRNLVGSCQSCNQAKASSVPNCTCGVCVVAYQYHRDLIEAVRAVAPVWSAAIIELGGDELAAIVYGPLTVPSPTERGESHPQAARLLRYIR